MIMHIPVWGEKFWNLFARNFIFSWEILPLKRDYFCPWRIQFSLNTLFQKIFFIDLSHFQCLTSSNLEKQKMLTLKNKWKFKDEETFKKCLKSNQHFTLPFFPLLSSISIWDCIKKFKLKKKNYVSITCNRKNCLIHIILHIKNVTSAYE